LRGKDRGWQPSPPRMTGGALKRDLLSHLRMASGKRVPDLTPKSGHAKIVVLLDKKEQNE
jgi:hypothetical protein